MKFAKSYPPKSWFNDDDLYVFNPDTHEIIERVPASRRFGYRVPEGLASAIGLGAKYLPLWRALEAA